MTPEQSLPATAGETKPEVSPVAESSNATAITSRDAAATQETSQVVDQEEEEIQEAPPPLPQRRAHLPQPQMQYMPYPGVPVPNQQQQPQIVYATPMRPLPKQRQAYIATRLGLTALSSVWGIIIIALTSILISHDGNVTYTALYAYPIVAASIVWNTAELITYCARVRNDVQRGIHPAAHVSLHLIFWLAGVLAILLTVLIYSNAMDHVIMCEDDDPSGYTAYYYYDSCYDSAPLYYWKSTILPTLRAQLAIFALWLINHFVLFVLACIETHKRNALKPAAYLVPMAAKPNGAPVMYYSPQQQQQQQPGMQPMQYNPSPTMMQSQGPAKQPSQLSQISRDLAGFYAPVAGPGQIRQPPPAQMASNNLPASSANNVPASSTSPA